MGLLLLLLLVHFPAQGMGDVPTQLAIGSGLSPQKPGVMINLHYQLDKI